MRTHTIVLVISCMPDEQCNRFVSGQPYYHTTLTRLFPETTRMVFGQSFEQPASIHRDGKIYGISKVQSDILSVIFTNLKALVKQA